MPVRDVREEAGSANSARTLSTGFILVDASDASVKNMYGDYVVGWCPLWIFVYVVPLSISHNLNR
jgi:hypothetical protein